MPQPPISRCHCLPGIIIALLPVFLLPTPQYALLGPVQYIDDNPGAAGVEKIVSADLNNDGLSDIVVAQAYNIDQVAYYLNEGNGDFSEAHVADSLADDPNALATGDFNDNGWIDIAVVSGSGGEVYWLPNSEAGFSGRIQLATGLIFGNGVVAHDFDGNGSLDLVVIGQHSIDKYLNDGTGEFQQEPILTTSTSPNILECIDIEKADINNDGHMDVVTAETTGGVAYINDGNANFTPVIITPLLTASLIHSFDANGDALPDILLKHTASSVGLFINQGDTAFSDEIDLFDATNLQSIASADIDGDNDQDIYAAPGYAATTFENQDNNDFASGSSIFDVDSVAVTEIALADLNNDGHREFIWSGINGPIAYRENTLLGVSTQGEMATLKLFPNPTRQKVTIGPSKRFPIHVTLLNANGQILKAQKLEGSKKQISLAGLPPGVYYLHVRKGKSIVTRKVVLR